MFAKNIKYLRKKRGLSQQALADKLGYRSNVAVHKWESGENTPAVDSVKLLAHLFGVSMEDITSVDLERRDAEAIEKKAIEVTAARAIPIIDGVTVENGLITGVSACGIAFADNASTADSCFLMPDNSMKSVGLWQGDKILLKRDFEPRNGKIYAVVAEENIIIRRVTWADDVIVLTGDVLPVVKSDIVIFGECVGVYHEI